MKVDTHNWNQEAGMPPTPCPSPKLLPWLAGRAGISDERALALWQQARRDAPGDAMPRFIALLEEVRRPGATSPAAWLELCDRVWRGNTLRLTDVLLTAAYQGWQGWYGRVGSAN
ncbi:MAG: hypothetical protein AB1899_07455 [Pseudomonadota bacterium]